eukprot:2596666-Prymnesium_polylepis.1
MDEALAYLWRSANEHVHDAPELSRLYAQQMLSLAARKKLPLPGRVLHRVCEGCHSLLVPGLDCRVSQTSHPRRPAARRRSLLVRCAHCGHTSSFATPARTSSRIGQESLAAPNAKALGKTQAAGGGAGSKQRAPKSSGAAPVSGLAGSKRKQPDSGTAGTKPRPKGGAPLPSKPPTKPEPKGAAALFGFDFVPL